jgi:hypothetical protein
MESIEHTAALRVFVRWLTLRQDCCPATVTNSETFVEWPGDFLDRLERPKYLQKNPLQQEH